MTPNSPAWTLAIYFIAVVFIVAGMLVISHFAGSRRKHDSQSAPYESGMVPTGSTHVHLSVAFYLVAMFFLIFDLEAVFIFAWAVSVRQTGWPAYVEMLIFVGVLMAGLAYLWHQGALDWSLPAMRNSRYSRQPSKAEESLDA